MKRLKLFCPTFFQLAAQIWLLPRTLANIIKQRTHQTALNELETERLDRIRNPSKYRGK